MSSFMKKTGGLAFKPKVGRRPGPATATASASASASASAAASQTTTRAPTAEPSQPSSVTPAPAAPTPSPAHAPSEEPAAKPPLPPNPDEPQPPPAPTAQSSRPAESAPAPASVLAEPANPAPSQPTIPRQTPSATRTVPASHGRRQNSTPAPNAGHAQAAVSDTPGSSLPDSASRHPLPHSTSRSQPLVSPVTQEPSTGVTTATATAGLPSPAVTAIRQPSAAPGNATPSPSPLPSSETAPLPTPLSQPQADGTQENGATGVTPSTAGAPVKKRQYRRRKQPADAETEAQEGETPALEPKRPRKRKAPTTAVEGQEAEAPASGEAAAAAAPQRFRRRRITPEPDTIPEDGRPDHTTTKIGDLTRDLGIGKKFKHADLIAERQRQAKHDAKLRKLERQKRAMGLLPPEEIPQNGSRGEMPAGGEGGDNIASGAQGNRGQGIDFDIIDGQIMINQSSLVINQHAVEADVQLETVEEDEFTHLTTSASYMRPSRALGPNHWDDEDTEKFYKYLKMFGTDFETISHMFPGRNRRQIKLKFNREEKHRPNRVDAAIMAKGEKRVAIDIEEYKSNRSGFNDPWITPDKFHAEQEQLRQEQEKELEAKRQERRDLGLLEDEIDPSKKSGTDDSKGHGEEEVEEELLVDDQDVGGAATMVAT
ncbi:hypothetical protein BKA67DRAFT_535318 [Truncatella angustata]|uniref:Myb-like domain-containing protein n=1 Tax=Truncatella angustata TaxID=152316 RepID=A0A9P8UKX5_9PEZI|nr:uncharacterized protein BKA67DRAFT_535318 [Truncatella angustata]KAH6653971.1 hypothetical protein BKA67DRAFT_535318 [Truncatella angustata]KAH8198046.1 hypothetical protein TruAng_007770 [Truncatella angustata]